MLNLIKLKMSKAYVGDTSEHRDSKCCIRTL